jgi:hypothetical protein
MLGSPNLATEISGAISHKLPLSIRNDLDELSKLIVEQYRTHREAPSTLQNARRTKAASGIVRRFLAEHLLSRSPTTAAVILDSLNSVAPESAPAGSENE